jgi:RNA-splicing ligase RtcB
MEQIKTEHGKIMNWASILEDTTRQQAIETASMPFIFPHIALMPDAHLGKGATVGSVIPTLGAIMPAAVGVDIGCGMMAVRTQFHQWDLSDCEHVHGLNELHADIARRIPLSMGKYNAEHTDTASQRICELYDDEFWGYMEALRWAQRFAFLNREEMMDRVVDAFEEWIGERVERTEVVNCHHNYTQRERHFGKDVWLSRKGAISAKDGELGLIPGSMGDLSYVVVGKGNRLALESSPHGAGRNHSRTVARKLFTLDDLDEKMKGIAWGHSSAFLDEHPNAYKPIDVVMDDAKDLVEVKHTLRQIVNVKGD